MDKRFKERLLAEAARIGDELIASGIRVGDGLYWNIYAVEANGAETAAPLEYITSGACGGVLFLTALHRAGCGKKYLEAALDAEKWINRFCTDNPTEFYGFLTGRIGVSYTFWELYRETGDPARLMRALTLIKNCGDFFLDFRLKGNLINGAAGALLGLLHLYAGLRRLPSDHFRQLSQGASEMALGGRGEADIFSRILTLAEPFVAYLLDSAWPAPSGGIYWDRSGKTISGPTGFAAGTSGIAFVFLELARFLDLPAFYLPAELAVKHERFYYNPRIQNWPNLQIDRDKFEDYAMQDQACREGDLDFFRRGADVNSWFYGAAGIGLCRLRGWELQNDPQWLEETEWAENRVWRDMEAGVEKGFHVLADGAAGNAEFLLRASLSSRYPHRELNRNRVETAAEMLLDYRRRHGRYRIMLKSRRPDGDVSLFSGTPGVGYFYLRLAEPGAIPSLLCPELPSETAAPPGAPLKNGIWSVQPEEIRKRIVRRYFPRTLALLENREHGTSGWLEKLGENRDETFYPESFAREAASRVAAGSVAADAFGLEWTGLKMDAAVFSHNLLAARERLRARDAAQWRDAELRRIHRLTLQLDEDFSIHLCGWDWDLSHDARRWRANENTEAGQYPVLLKTAPEGIREIPLDPFTYAVLSAFASPAPVETALENILLSIRDVPPEMAPKAAALSLEQIREALAAGVLREKKGPGD